jgi:hypothetical protein
VYTFRMIALCAALAIMTGCAEEDGSEQDSGSDGKQDAAVDSGRPGAPDANAADAASPRDSETPNARDAQLADGGTLKGCYSSQDCSTLPGTTCSAARECLKPPGCAPGDGGGCPTVCYGYCL